MPDVGEIVRSLSVSDVPIAYRAGTWLERGTCAAYTAHRRRGSTGATTVRAQGLRPNDAQEPRPEASDEDEDEDEDE
jgi:hypothetical protein